MEIKRENDRKLRFDGHGMAWLWFVVGWMYYELRFRDVDSMLQIKSYPTTKLSDWQNGKKKRNTKRTPQFCSPNQIEKWSEKKSKTEKGAKKSESKQKSCTSEKIYDIHIVSLKNDHKYLALQEYQLLLYGMEYKRKNWRKKKKRTKGASPRNSVQQKRHSKTSYYNAPRFLSFACSATQPYTLAFVVRPIPFLGCSFPLRSCVKVEFIFATHRISTLGSLHPSNGSCVCCIVYIFLLISSVIFAVVPFCMANGIAHRNREKKIHSSSVVVVVVVARIRSTISAKNVR